LRSVAIFLNGCVLGYTIVNVLRYDHANKENRDANYFSGLIKELLRRLFWYPVVQAIARVFTSYYVLKYPPSPGSFLSKPDSTVQQAIALFLYGILSPSAGVGGFLVFLFIQQGAKKKLYEIMFGCCTKTQNDTTDRLTKDMAMEMEINVDMQNDPTMLELSSHWSFDIQPQDLLDEKDEEDLTREIIELAAKQKAPTTTETTIGTSVENPVVSELELTTITSSLDYRNSFIVTSISDTRKAKFKLEEEQEEEQRHRVEETSGVK